MGVAPLRCMITLHLATYGCQGGELLCEEWRVVCVFVHASANKNPPCSEPKSIKVKPHLSRTTVVERCVWVCSSAQQRHGNGYMALLCSHPQGDRVGAPGSVGVSGARQQQVHDGCVAMHRGILHTGRMSISKCYAICEALLDVC